MKRRMKWLVFALMGVLAAGSIAFAGCNGDGDDGGTATPTDEATGEATAEGTAEATATGEAHSETPGPDATTIALTTTEGDVWDIEAESTTLAPGQYIFEITNPAENEFDHEVEILQGAAGTDQEELAEVEDIAPGETKTLVVTLTEPGDYEFACVITEEHDGEEIDHYELGMHSDFVVE